MKKIAVFVTLQFALLTAIAIPVSAGAQEVTQLDSLVQVVRRLEYELGLLTALQEVADEPYVTEAPDQRMRGTSGIAGRPFVYAAGGTAVGGYVDLEFAAELGSGRSTFRQHRLIPFIFAEVTDRIHFGMEVEFEDGGPDAPNGDGEVKVEFAAVDVSLTAGLNFRAGALLAPLGKFNLTHDSPVNDLTDRPLVGRSVIPTTFTEAGVGVFGTIFPGEQSVLTYEAYIVNGLDHALLYYDATVASGDTTVTPGIDVRAARGSLKRDNNGSRSLTGRIGFSPLLGAELGLSGHTGRYGDSGSGRFTILALDGIVQRGRFELLGEVARSTLSIDAATERVRARAVFDAATGLSGPALDQAFDNAFAAAAFPAGQLGYYLQLNYHFGQEWIRAFQHSTFTGVLRWGRVDQDRSGVGGVVERLTVGANLRLVEQTVIKVSYQWNWSIAAGATSRGPSANRVVASLASYF